MSTDDGTIVSVSPPEAEDGSTVMAVSVDAGGVTSGVEVGTPPPLRVSVGIVPVGGAIVTVTSAVPGTVTVC